MWWIWKDGLEDGGVEKHHLSEKIVVFLSDVAARIVTSDSGNKSDSMPPIDSRTCLSEQRVTTNILNTDARSQLFFLTWDARPQVFFLIWHRASACSTNVPIRGHDSAEIMTTGRDGRTLLYYMTVPSLTSRLCLSYYTSQLS